ncbi:hypothetical protein ACFQ0M_42520 [Kitasatospora aburaviensis]
MAETAERCLRAHHGPPAPGRTALLLASTDGDRATARAIDEAAASGRRVPPLLFFQSNPNAVLGHIAARWGLTGPVVAISPAESPPGRVPQDALALAALLLADGDADHVLIIAAEQGEPTGRPAAEPAAGTPPEPATGTGTGHTRDAGPTTATDRPSKDRTGTDRPSTDRAVAVLVTTG